MGKDPLLQTNMLIKSIIDEDFVNYKKASMYIAFPHCTFKCERDCGVKCCQNSPLARAKDIDVSFDYLLSRYMNNPITHAFVFAGLEPLDSFDDVLEFIEKIREKTDDDIVIYTGYNENEVLKEIRILCDYKNIIMKFGRYKPNDTPRFDDILGVKLASSNQYAKRISIE